MENFKISVDLSGIMEAGGVINRTVFPLLRQAVGAIARQAKHDWKDSVKEAHLWGVEKKAYYQSIKWKYTGEFSAVVWSDYAQAEEIETGRPAKDLKKMLQTSTKTRTNKKGQKYLIIPMRHNTPANSALGQAMPEAVYDAVRDKKEFARSKIVEQGFRRSATGHLVNRNIYQWGDRLQAGLVPKLKDHHKTDKYAGMVAFSTGKRGRNSSTYLTFRVMSEASSGWIVPAKPGLYLARAVTERLQPLAEQAMQEAIRRTLG